MLPLIMHYIQIKPLESNRTMKEEDDDEEVKVNKLSRTVQLSRAAMTFHYSPLWIKQINPIQTQAK